MTTIQADNFDWIPLTGAKPSGKRPYFFDDPAVERVLAITMAVAQEVAVIRERLDTVERLLEKNGSITRADIDTYAPDPASATERADWQRMYIARVLRIVQQEIEAMSKPENNVDIEAQAEDLKRN